MIEENKDINKDAYVKRLIHPDSTARQITLTDSRFYQRDKDRFYHVYFYLSFKLKQ